MKVEAISGPKRLGKKKIVLRLVFTGESLPFSGQPTSLKRGTGEEKRFALAGWEKLPYTRGGGFFSLLVEEKNHPGG